ncbi:MAG: hypothetical protein AAF198_13440 [Pseudomonadota bacterium]
MGLAVAGSDRPARSRQAIFNQASRLGLKGLRRDVDVLDKAAADSAHPLKHKFVDQRKVYTTEAKLTKAANVAARRRAWVERDRGAMALRSIANVLLNLICFAAIFGAVLKWIGVI